MARQCRALVAAALLAPASANKCPGSSAWGPHASAQVTVTAQASCADVMAEMYARVAGTESGSWYDPHNRGTYSVLSQAEKELNLQRVTGNKKYTDKQTFTFSDSAPGTCEIEGCSESQVFSIADFSTNYCDLRMLYCGSKDGCKPAKIDFAIVETSVSTSPGAGKNPSSCLAVKSFGPVFLSSVDASLPTCPPAGFSTATDFELDSFISSRWYIQQQMATTFLPASENSCVYAEYKLFERTSFWGYNVGVHNHAEEVAPPHKVHDSGSVLCAKIVDAAAGKLAVAPCFVPSVAAGPYWVIDYSEREGYALISGGAPMESAPGGCRTGVGVNHAGVWIFTRKQKRNETLIQKVRTIAEHKGFDLSVLNDVDQTACTAMTLLV